MKLDSLARDYDQLLGLQAQHLADWKTKLQPAVHAEISAYLKTHTAPAPDSTTRHRVYVGYDLVRIVMDWPTPKNPYPQRSELEDV